MQREQREKRGGGDRERKERPKKEAILDLNAYSDKKIRVQFTGGREGLYPFVSLD